jgi:hypothetical protein
VTAHATKSAKPNVKSTTVKSANARNAIVQKPENATPAMKAAEWIMKAWIMAR